MLQSNDTIRDPRWIYLTISLPQIVILVLFYFSYEKIFLELSKEQVTSWKIYGSALLITCLSLSTYAAYCQIKRKLVAKYLFVPLVLIYLIFSYSYCFNYGSLVPQNLATWLVDPLSLILYPSTFIMPSFLYAIFLAVRHFTNFELVPKAWKSFISAISIPIFVYLIYIFFPSSYRMLEKGGYLHLLVTLAIAATLVFFFFLLRFFYILLNKSGLKKIWGSIIAKVIIGLCFPVAGLLLNKEMDNVFGNFEKYYFFILAVANGFFLLIPFQKLTLSLQVVTYFFRCTGLSYVLYFLVVLMPFFPLSLLFILAAGLGFLLLTPLALSYLQAKAIRSNFNLLNQNIASSYLIAIGLAGFTLLPATITTNFLLDRYNINSAIEYLFEPDYIGQDSVQVDLKRLKASLERIKLDQKPNRHALSLGQNTPYLSNYYRLIVLENASLSRNKLEKIERSFFGKTTLKVPTGSQLDFAKAKLIKASTTSKVIPNGAIKTSLLLEMHNSNKDLAEYQVNFQIPDGVFVSNYHLWVGKEKIAGQIREKKSAIWIYNRIKNSLRDPGLLYYKNKNELSLKVFPFEAKQTRYTEIEFLHQESFILDLKTKKLVIGENQDINRAPKEIYSSKQDLVYLNSSARAKLDRISLKPQIFFLLDNSIYAKRSQDKKKYIQAVKNLITRHPELAKNAKIALLNYDLRFIDYQSDWENEYLSASSLGGMVIDRAVKSILLNNLMAKSKTIPKIIVVSDDLKKAIVPEDMSSWSNSYFEAKDFYQLKSSGDLLSRGYKKPKASPNKVMGQELFKDELVQVWPSAKQPLGFLKNSYGPAIVYLGGEETKLSNSQDKQDLFRQALDIYSTGMEEIYFPNKNQRNWKDMIIKSISTGILSFSSAYIVLETEEQRKALQQRHKKRLDQRKSLDLDGDIREMPEPHLTLLVLLILAFWGYRNSANKDKLKQNFA